ncbi:MAG: hypothetical protein JNM12_09850 [Alphaproteobacteria bacterium]|nr:hypothetical protein [Alphaproteobacteria bacterium]
MRRVVVAAFAILLSFCVLSAPVHAETATKKPTKESLLEAWEQNLKKNEYTVKLEKTTEQGVYDYETTIFPYAGKLKVLNTFIDAPGSYYYDEDDAENFSGTVEVELAGVAKEFKEQYQRSYYAWLRGNSLTYNDRTNKWYTPSEWAGYKKILDTVKDKAVCEPTEQKKEAAPTFLGVLLSWFPMLLLIGVWFFFLIAMRKPQKKQALLVDRAFAHYDKTEKLLEEILEETKRKT